MRAAAWVIGIAQWARQFNFVSFCANASHFHFGFAPFLGLEL